jgi:hypothetical protein
MTRRHLVGMALAVFVVLVPLAAAAETDTYRGHLESKFFTGDGYRRARISFMRTENRIHHVRFEIRVRCPNDQHRSKVARIRGSTKLHGGRFAGGELFYRQVGPGDPPPPPLLDKAIRIKGRLLGDRASGRASLDVRLDRRGRESPRGEICSSGWVERGAVAP